MKRRRRALKKKYGVNRCSRQNPMQLLVSEVRRPPSYVTPNAKRGPDLDSESLPRSAPQTASRGRYHSLSNRTNIIL